MKNLKPDTVLKGALLLAAFASFVLSVTIYFMADDVAGQLNGVYVGIWVPSILSLGAFMLANGKKES